jgi:uncharacterized protein
MNKQPARIVACPTCRKPVHWADTSRFKPFCSERCRLIDLGAWADGTHRIPAEEPAGDDDATREQE